MMATTRGWSKALRGWAVVIGTALLVAATAGSAVARIDEFGGASSSAPYAPYTAGPVVKEEARPYAPYTAGPVIFDTDLPYAPYTAGPVVKEEERPYAPYTAGPVIFDTDLPYAPYTAGPVVDEQDKGPDRIGHHLLR